MSSERSEDVVGPLGEQGVVRRADDCRIGQARGADQQAGDERGALLVQSGGRLVQRQRRRAAGRARARSRPAGAPPPRGDRPRARCNRPGRGAPATRAPRARAPACGRRAGSPGRAARSRAQWRTGRGPAPDRPSRCDRGGARPAASRSSPPRSAPATMSVPASGRSRPAMRCSSVVLPEPERPSTATSAPRVKAASKPDEHRVCTGAAAIALVDPAQRAHDLAARPVRSAGASLDRLAHLAVAGERHLAARRSASSRGRRCRPRRGRSAGRRTQPPRPTTSLCDPPRSGSPLIRPSRTCTTRSARSVGGLVMAHDRRASCRSSRPARRAGVDDARGAPVELARGLVGRSSAGAWASAAQAATRCCSPPESAAGRSSARSARPMPSSSSRARAPPFAGRDPSECQRQRDVVGARERGGERARVVLVEEAELLGAEGAPPGARRGA